MLGLWSCPAKGATPAPNILFVFADDWGRYASIYAKVDGPGTLNDAIKTPNFDRVAREGVVFRHAFINAPSCTPCRSALLSGQYFWRTGRGAILQGAVWDPSIPSFPLLLRGAGYHIGKSYKVWSPGTPADAPYGTNRFAYEKAGRRFNQFSQNVTAMARQGRSVEEAKQVLYEEVMANFNAFLADRKPGQPFCYWFGPTHVHRKWVKGSGKALWGIDPDRLRGKLPKFLPDVPEVREDLADYFGEAQALDAALGLLLKKLAEIGELDRTLVVVSGDHGAPGFPYGKCNLYDFGVRVALAVRGPGVKAGRVVDDFVNLMDLAPTFLEAGGVTPPDVMTGRSLMNLLKSEKSGLVDSQRTFVISGRERHVAAAREGFVPYPQRALRTRDYLYIVNFKPDRWPMGDPYNLTSATAPTVEALTENTMVTFMDMDSSPTKAWLVTHRDDAQWKRHYQLAFGKRPREELYILADDPDEVNNGAADPKYAEIRQELERQLMAELRRTSDPRVTGDGSHFEKPPLAGPVAPNKQPAAGKPKKETDEVARPR
ncbi:MAG: sulfatase [Verrucomicrobia bacterium]|nr:sulfatase [Verrucomicrobiota bacterium]